MVGLSRKQREIREREQQILAIARPILLTEGYAALSMDRLASAMEYAKGTLYNHFPNKEEIVLALALEAMEVRLGFFEAASYCSPKSRERILAIGCACDYYATECAGHFAIEQLLRYAVIWEKSSERRRNHIRNCEHRCMAIVAGIVRDAVATGDLTLPDSMSPEEIVFAFWSLTFGSHVLIASSPSLLDLGIRDAGASVRFHAMTLLNGLQWQPLMTFAEAESVRDSLMRKFVAQAT